MRRGQSIFGPLVLILLGLLFLVRNFIADFPFWELVGKYWPLVLVAWGVAKLLDAARRPAGEQARPSVGVGEFFLALLLVTVGLGASKFHTIDLPIFYSGHNYTQNLRQQVQAGAPLQIDLPHGDVRIVGSDSTEIVATVNTRIEARSKEAADRTNAELRAELARQGNGYLLRIGGRERVSTQFEITVPKKTPLRLDVRRGSAEVSGTQGEITGEMDRGDLSLFQIMGNVRVQLRRGSLEARNISGNVDVDGRGSDVRVSDVTGHAIIRGEFSGTNEYARIAEGVKFSSSRTEMEIQKLPGRLEMTIGSLAISEPGGLVSVHTRNKDIQVDDFSEKLQIINRGARVELRTTKLPLKDIEVENHSGSIVLAVPEKSEFQIEANARRGDVASPDFELDIRDESAKGKVGQAQANIRLNTSYGTIELRKVEMVREEKSKKERRRRDEH